MIIFRAKINGTHGRHFLFHTFSFRYQDSKINVEDSFAVDTSRLACGVL